MNKVLFAEKAVGALASKSSFTRRGRLDVLYEILLFCRKPQHKTQIMFSCNLSYELLKKYLDFLVSNNLLRVFEDEESKRYYQTTDHGKRFISEYESIKRVLG
ncbi:hypothetical protein KEJ34_04080 [Candidatus Bathyarchaeota archaeon]|nr:hypothetical protein [Candidatus Bathyarchaeota archaeon]